MATELFLRPRRFDTRAAATVAEAEILLADIRPGDILITDYHLNGTLTGLDMITQLRIQQGRDVPAILLSGDLESMMRAIKTSIPRCRFLSKPVDTPIVAHGHIRTQRRVTLRRRRRVMAWTGSTIRRRAR